MLRGRWGCSVVGNQGIRCVRHQREDGQVHTVVELSSRSAVLWSVNTELAGVPGAATTVPSTVSHPWPSTLAPDRMFSPRFLGALHMHQRAVDSRSGGRNPPRGCLDL